MPRFRALLSGWLDRWTSALVAEPTANKTVALSLAAYAAAWMLYRVVSTLPRDIHIDMSEAYAWSRDLAFGYEKHPPLSAAIVRLWFSIFPVSDVAFTALAAINIAVTLWIAWLIFRSFMGREKSILGIVLLVFIPFYNFHSLKYNANTVLLPLWAATIYFFLLAYRSRQWLPSVLAGLFAGASLLGKYWSIFLIVGIGLAALADRRRAAFFSSPAPYLMAGVGLIVIAPHVLWILAAAHNPLAYASIHRADEGIVLRKDAIYLIESIAYLAAALVLTIAIVRPGRTAWLDILQPADDDRRLAAMVLVLPFVLPALLAPIPHIVLTPLWTIPNWALLPVVLLSSPLITVTPEQCRAGLSLATALTVGALIVAPVVALGIQLTAPLRSEDYASAPASVIRSSWNEVAGGQVPLVVGEFSLATSVGFYLNTRSQHAGTDLKVQELLADKGGAFVCVVGDQSCTPGAISALQQILDKPVSKEIEVSRSLFGIHGPELRYVILLSVPQSREK